MKKSFSVSLFAASALVLTACETTVMQGITEAGMAAAETRTFGEVIDDAGIYTEINHYFLQTDINDLLPNVNVIVRQGRVLLIGIVDKQRTRELAVQKAWAAKGVKEVINEIEVDPTKGIANRANDEWIEKQVEAKLTITKGVNILNYSVEVVNGKVYLLGLVGSEQELKNVLAITRRVKGVQQVVSHLRLARPDELVNQEPAAPTHPDIPYRR